MDAAFQEFLTITNSRARIVVLYFGFDTPEYAARWINALHLMPSSCDTITARVQREQVIAELAVLDL